MTANQSNQLVKNPNTKKAVAVLTKFAALEVQYKAAEKEAKAASELIKDAMIEANVPKIDIDVPGFTGYITLATRTAYKAEDLDAVADEFKKPTLDTDKVKASEVLADKLPAGVEKVESRYITKKFKAV